MQEYAGAEGQESGAASIALRLADPAHATRHKVVCRLSPEEERIARQAAGSDRAVFSRTDADLIRALSNSDIHAIVWEFSIRGPRRLPLPEEVVEAAQSIPLLLLADSRPSSCRGIIALLGSAPDIRLSLRGSGDLERDVSQVIRHPGEPSAEQTILESLVRCIPPPVLEIVLIAAIVAKRRTSVDRLATLCKCSAGKLRYRLKVARGPDPRELLGELTSLHVAWRRGQLDWTSKRVAHETGYSDTVALDHFVRNHAGVGLFAMGNSACFWTLLEDLAGKF